MPFMLGRKLQMSQIVKNGKIVPVTLIEAGPCTVTQVKSKEKDGYAAVQIGFKEVKELNQALKGHLKDLGNFRHLREFKDGHSEQSSVKKGDVLNAGVFKEGELINISAISKGRGFQGVVKRHGFHGGPKSHGQKDRLRAPGSIGATTPQRVIKGHKLPGRMGGERFSVKNLKILDVNQEKNLIILKGSIPGTRGTLVEIKSTGRVSKKI